MKHINLPTAITLIRVLLIPVFVILALQDAPAADLWALILFVLASFSDMLDGHLARRMNLVTDLGKFIDPLADKMLVCSAMVCLTARHMLPAWIFIVIICRDLAVDGMRLVAAQQGEVIAASIWGKSKTVLYAIASIFSIVYIVAAAFVAPGSWNQTYEMVLYALFALSAAASLLSFVTYLSSVLRSGALSGMTR